MSDINWQQVINNLRESGMAQAEIAEQCKVSQAAIQQLNSGKTKEPKFSIGEKLIYLLGSKAVKKQKTPSGN